MESNQLNRCCRNCGYVTWYRGTNKGYECMQMRVDPRGICDRYQKKMSPSEITKQIDRKLKELDQVADGCYVPRQVPPFHRNYHLQGGK